MIAAVKAMDDSSQPPPSVDIQFLAEALFQPGQIEALTTSPKPDDFADELVATVWPVVQAILAEGRDPTLAGMVDDFSGKVGEREPRGLTS